MITFGMISSLISIPGNSVGNSFVWERIRTAGKAGNFFGLLTVTFLFAVLADGNTILGLETAKFPKQNNS